MASYGYGYGNFTSQPQQYAAAASYASQNGTYGYAAQPPVSRVVQGYQQPAGTAAYASTAFAQPQVPVASAGYGYFQRTTDPNTAYATAQKTSQGYGYGTTAVKATSYSGASYPKQNAFVAAASSNFSGYTTQRPTVTTPTYNNTAVAAKPKTTTVTPATSTHQNAYEKVVYNAATSFLTQQAQAAKPTWQKSEKPTFKLQNHSKGWQNRNTGPPKPQQLHYCEVCKISCAGPQTYKEHLEGQKHKKKAASTTSDSKNLAPGTYKCELCDVVCTGKDAYNAHVKGANHQKTHKLHMKLGKPIPEVKVFTAGNEDGKKAEIKTSVPPKITFVGGKSLTSTSEEKNEELMTDKDANQIEIPVEGEVIGEEYVEDIKSDVGKVIGFKCTLCDCRFNDVVAKTAHMKGRRHRLSYKKKVDPKLKVDMKGSSSRKRLDIGGRQQEMVWKQRQHEQMKWEQQLRFREEELRRWEHEEYMRRASEDRYWTRPDRNRMHELEYYEWERREKYMFSNEPQSLFKPHPPPTPDDRLIMVKHNEIYPSESELKQVQSMVASAEKALKLVSDALGESTKPEDRDIKIKEEDSSLEKRPEPLMKEPVKEQPNRILKGVMRVGALAKGLLLKGQLSVELVVLCAEKPTYTLLKKIGKLAPEKLKEVAPEEKFNTSISLSECAVLISSTSEPKCTVKVSLTSPAMREGEEDEKKESEDNGEALITKKEPVDPKDVLDKEKALQALAALRHAKWFQARANQIVSCVVTIRVMRELCHRVPAFKPLSNWAVELLCEKSLSSSFQPLGPGEAFRRVLEAVASGLFLPGGTGLLDPCEKERKAANDNMTAQEREDITGAAQHALRLQAFRQLHKILAVEPLKPNPIRSKRRADDIGSNDTATKAIKKE